MVTPVVAAAQPVGGQWHTLTSLAANTCDLFAQVKQEERILTDSAHIFKDTAAGPKSMSVS